MTTAHGWLACRRCFDGATDPNWRLVHNPGYWGAAAPEVLVLGFSKGVTQNTAAIASPFESVAFAGMRSRLVAALVAVGVLAPRRAADPDQLFRRDEAELGFASLIRCSLLMRSKDDWVGSGTIMPKAVRSIWPGRVVSNCVSQHLVPLPGSVTRVVLLGITPAYIASVTRTIAAVYPDLVPINPVAFNAGGVVWAFCSHPSGLNGHFNKWLREDASGPLGRKREWARSALSHA